MSTNVKTEVKGNQLILTIDLTQRIKPSKSGKTVLIATASEKVAGHDGISFSLNAFIKANKA